MIEILKYGQEPRPGLILPSWYSRRKRIARKQEGMLWVPQKGILRVEHNTGGVGTATPGTAVTTGAASTTKGTPAEIFASTSFDTYWLRVVASDYATPATNSQGCLDILIGAATEEVLIANLLMGSCGRVSGSAERQPKTWDFPLYIPAASRIAAQAAGARVSTAMRVWMFLYGGDGLPPFRLGGKVTTYGVTVPNGTAITPGGSGAEGAWTQIAASSSEDHFAFVPSFQPSADTTLNDLAFQVDIGFGAATEKLLAEYWFGTTNDEAMGGPVNSMPAFQDVPSGTRLVMRASNSGANDAGYSGAIHAVS